MVTALESKAGLALIAGDAADTIEWTLRRTRGSFEERRRVMLETTVPVVGYYSEGSAALAVDFYDESRVGAQGRYAAAPVILDRTVKIRRGVAWATGPIAEGDEDTAAERLMVLVRAEVNRPYRDTILTNQSRDPQAVGWRRITSPGACAFCRALADRGAVYKASTARFAAHGPVDNCTAAPVFVGQEMGPEASTLQYTASRKRISAKQRADLKSYLDSFYPDK